MEKRFLSIALVLCVLLTLVPATVFAEGTPNFQVTTSAGTTTGYDTFSDALNAAQANSGNVLKLYTNVTCDDIITIESGEFTIDATGQTFTGTIHIGTGTETGGSANVTIKGGTFKKDPDEEQVIVVKDGGTLNILSGNFENNIQSSARYTHSTLNISNGIFTYVKSSSWGSITGGSFEDLKVAGISENLKISGGEYDRLGVLNSWETLNTYLAEGYAIRQGGEWKNAVVTIIGNYLVAHDYDVKVVPIPITDFTLQLSDPSAADTMTLTISNPVVSSGYNASYVNYAYKVDGGSWSASTASTTYTFDRGNTGNHTVSVKATLDGYTLEKSIDYNVIAPFQVIETNGTTTGHETFSAALNDAQTKPGSELKCNADVNEDITINSGTFTINVNGKKITGHTTIKSGANVTIDGDGTFNPPRGSSALIGVENGATLTIKSGTFGTALGVIGCSGTLNISGGTFRQINASGNGTITDGSFWLLRVAGNTKISGGEYMELRALESTLNAYLAEGYAIKNGSNWVNASSEHVIGDCQANPENRNVQVVPGPIDGFDLQLSETADGQVKVEVTNIDYSVGYENENFTDQVLYQYKLDSGEWSASMQANTYTFAPGNAGDHKVHVRVTLGCDYENSADYYVIDYRSDDGVGSIPSGVKFPDVGYTLSADTFTRTGYTQIGWKTYDGERVYALGGKYTANTAVTFYPVWEVNQYTLTVKPENGDDDITIKQDYGTTVIAPTLTRDGYAFDGWDKDFPTTMPAENMTITAKWKDVTAPTGEILLGTNSWKTFLNNITFGLFFKETQEVTITATDNSGELVTIEYLLSDKELMVDELSTATFTAYNDKFIVEPNNEYVIYAKLTDKTGNITYINSNGIVLDNIAPVIFGIANGKTYCEVQTVTVSDKYEVTVTVNGTQITLDANGQFTLSPASGTQTVVATDKAGNVSAEMIVTANDGHEGGTATCTKKAVCKHCSLEYGEIDNNNHDLENIKESAATVTETGNTEYWHCKDCDNNFSDEDGKTKIDLKDTVTPKLPPEIIDGKGQSLTAGEKKELTFRSNAAYSDFIRVEVDGKTVDGKNYTVKEGSTIVTLKADYVATLSVGEHTLGIVSESGTATTTFTVNAKVVNDNTSPATGDNSHMTLWFALLFVSGGALVGTVAYGKKRKYSAK